MRWVNTGLVVYFIDVEGGRPHADQGENKTYTVVTVSRAMQGIIPEQ